MKDVIKGLVLACLLASGTVIGAHAQWLNYKTPGVPRSADGTPRLDAPTPRAFDRHPDLSGVWMHDLTPIPELRRLFGTFIDEEIRNELPGMEGKNFHKYALNVLADFPADESPARPETRKAFEERLKNPRPEDLCDDTGLPFGFPLPGLLSEPIKIVQASRTTLVLYEVGGNFRQIYTDGRKLPTETNLPAYFGYSVGRWERDTFVVETAGFNEKAPLDAFGHPHSDQLRITERFRRRDFGHLDTEMTYDDPKMYTRPFTIGISYHLLADDDIFEMFSENEKDCKHIRVAGQAK
jgi:hypothetical protein